MNPQFLLGLLAAVLLTGCAQYATVTEIKPPRRDGLEANSREPINNVVVLEDGRQLKLSRSRRDDVIHRLHRLV